MLGHNSNLELVFLDYSNFMRTEAVVLKGRDHLQSIPHVTEHPLNIEDRHNGKGGVGILSVRFGTD